MFTNKIISKLKIVLRIITTLPSRIFFGNCTSFFKNIIPYRNLYYWKKIFSIKPLNKNGYEKINFNYDHKFIDKINDQFKKLIINKDKIFIFRNHDKKIFIKNPLEINGIKELTNIFDEKLKEYFAGYYKIIKISCWRTLYDESRDSSHEKYIYSNYWHFDDYAGDILKVFVLLNENTSKETGSTKLLNIKTTKKIARTFKYIDTSVSNNKLEKFLNEKKMIVYCDGNVGDVYIVNTSKCLHSASIPKKGESRDLIQFEVTFSNKNVDPFENFLKN